MRIDLLTIDTWADTIPNPTQHQMPETRQSSKKLLNSTPDDKDTQQNKNTTPVLSSSNIKDSLRNSRQSKLPEGPANLEYQSGVTCTEEDTSNIKS